MLLSEERYHRALTEGACVGCLDSAGLMSSITMTYCTECRAAHCGRCWMKTVEYRVAYWKWSCMHCGHDHKVWTVNSAVFWG